VTLNASLQIGDEHKNNGSQDVASVDARCLFKTPRSYCLKQKLSLPLINPLEPELFS